MGRSLHQCVHDQALYPSISTSPTAYARESRNGGDQGTTLRSRTCSAEPLAQAQCRTLFADFRGGAICLFRTHFLGWSGRFFHGCDGSFPRTRAPVPATGSGEPLGTDAEPGPSLSDGVRGPSHPPGGCSLTRPPTCCVTRPRAWSRTSILDRFASLLAGG